MTLLALTGVASLVVGVAAGAWLEARKWREKGLRGYPRKESGGSLYWVNRDDMPCERCAMDRGNVRRVTK